MKTTTKRTAESFRRNLITCPGDVFTIKGRSNCLSSTLTILIENENRDESFSVCWTNHLPVWEFLKRLNEMGGRTVLNQVGNNKPEPFEDSLPYKVRFQD